jgi:hypothetical protein
MELNKDFIFKYGLIYAVVMIVYVMLTYLAGVEFMISFTNVAIALLLPFAVALFIGFELRKALGGFMSWKQAFVGLLLTLFAGMIISSAFDFLLYTTIDPDLPMKTYEQTIEFSMNMAQDMGMGDEELDQMYHDLESRKEEILGAYTAPGFFRSLLTRFLLAGVVAALVGVFVKKENPNPFVDSE